MSNLTPIKKLRQWREEQGKSQDECARAVGTSRQVWSNWERGRWVPSRAFMPKIVQLTGGAITAVDFYPQTDDAALSAAA